jgi:dTDP-4-dehydrorhamnose reductase
MDAHSTHSSFSETVVIGASGYLGSAICANISRKSRVRRLLCHAEAPKERRYDFWKDDLGTILRKMGSRASAVVFAARVHNDSASQRDYERRIRRLVHGCSDCMLLVISTDAVFRGDRGQYGEEEIPDPVTAYGRCARRMEEIIQEEATRWCIVRSSYIYGPAPAGLDRRLAAAAAAAIENKPFNVYPNMFRSPIEVTELAQAVAELVSRDVHGFVHAGGPRISMAEFFTAGLVALGYRTDLLRPVSVTVPQPDTSLKIARLTRETSVAPHGVRDALAAAASRCNSEHT